MFYVCLFFGWLGVHKFIEKKTGAGILYLCTLGLFGVGWITDCIKYAKGGSVPKLNKRLSSDDSLPVVTSNLILSNGETCHYSGNVEHRTVKNKVVGHEGGSSGISFRVAKGVTFRTGASKGEVIRADVAEKTSGVLSITNNRIVFTATKGSFDKKIAAITSVIPYTNGCEIQISSNTYQFLTNEGEYICDIIRRIIEEQ